MVNLDNVTLQARINSARLIAIIRSNTVEGAVLTADTLFKAGIRALEVTLTLKEAAQAIRQIASFAPADAIVGAGTVITRSQVDYSIDAGAQFIVTPFMGESVSYALQQDIGVIAGAYSPTEIYSALANGAAAVKLFPASSVGPQFVKALCEPFPHARIIPVGGVSLENISEYFNAGAFAVGVGGPLVGDAVTPSGDHEALSQRARLFLKGSQR
jgi:2-dehydro-3-deoxyphosphogluconate aldolase/(4S)-4-hydroxy-2-oxoglutarate aldolase